MRLVSDLLVCLRLFSRFPLPAPKARELEPGAFAAAAGLSSLAGAIIGLVPAGALLAAAAFGLPPLLSAPLAIAALVLATGALHEDGLADCADGFGGGATRERKLEIMRDSRIGTFGACAIALSLYLRAFALGTIATHSVWLGATVAIFAASLSRAMCLVPLILLPPARTEGLGKTAGRPASFALLLAIGLAVLPGITTIVSGLPLAGLPLAIGFATTGVLALLYLASVQIGGQTGDVIGATQQMAEIGALLACAVFA